MADPCGGYGGYYGQPSYGGWGYGADMTNDYMAGMYGPSDAWSSEAMSDAGTEMSGTTMFSQDCSDLCGELANYDCPLPSGDCCEPPCGPEGEIVGDLNFEEEVPEKTGKKMCGEDLRRVNMIIQAITPATVLDEFMMSVAEYTPDKGEAMFDIMSNEVQNFKELIKEIYNSRNDNVSDLIRAQQRQMKKKYEKWTNDLTKRTEQAMEKLKQLLPNFSMAAYNEDPEGYIYNTIIEEMKRQEKLRMESEGCQNPGLFAGCGQSTSMTDRNYRVGLHKKTFLVREAEKIECENEARSAKLNEMMAQLACLSEGLATSNKKLAAYNRQLESQATCLRNKLAANERVINCMMDEVDVNKRDKTRALEVEDDDKCGIIRPDDILTPYPRGYDYC